MILHLCYGHVSVSEYYETYNEKAPKQQKSMPY